MSEPRWEQGSEFHWPVASEPQWPVGTPNHPWDQSGVLCGSGRDALRLLLHHGAAEFGWRRIWLPSYLCQEVLSSALSCGLPCVLYQDSPVIEAEWRHLADMVKPGDAVVVVNFFGLRKRRNLQIFIEVGAAVIEDHTHNPWSDWATESDADFCIASLRKTLPVADGGVLWSPIGHLLPAPTEITKERETAAQNKRDAMVLKGRYLVGESVSKDDYLSLFWQGESRIASGGISGISRQSAALVATLDPKPLLHHKAALFIAFDEALRAANICPLLYPEEHCIPFSAVCVFDDQETRDKVRASLIANRIYPAILWPLDNPLLPGVGRSELAFSQRMLSIHIDIRYRFEDLEMVVAMMQRSLVGKA
jgi:hypothetical protein